jgi:cell division protein FtsB
MITATSLVLLDDHNRARRDYDELAGQIARMRSENARLRDTARALREDPDMIEELARRELGLIKRGEMVFIIKDVAPAERTLPSPKP